MYVKLENANEMKMTSGVEMTYGKKSKIYNVY